MFDDGEDFDLGGPSTPPPGSPPETPFGGTTATGTTGTDDFLGAVSPPQQDPESPAGQQPPQEEVTPAPPAAVESPVSPPAPVPQSPVLASPTSPISMSGTVPPEDQVAPVAADTIPAEAVSGAPEPGAEPEPASPIVAEPPQPPSAPPVAPAAPPAPSPAPTTAPAPVAAAPVVPQKAEVDPFGGDDGADGGDFDPFGGSADETDDFLGGAGAEDEDPFAQVGQQQQQPPVQQQPPAPAGVQQGAPQQQWTTPQHQAQQQPGTAPAQQFQPQQAPAMQQQHLAQPAPGPFGHQQISSTGNSPNHQQAAVAQHQPQQVPTGQFQQPVSPQQQPPQPPAPPQFQQPPTAPTTPFGAQQQQQTQGPQGTSPPKSVSPLQHQQQVQQQPAVQQPLGQTQHQFQPQPQAQPQTQASFFTPNAHPGPPPMSSRSSTTSSVTRFSAKSPNTPFAAMSTAGSVTGGATGGSGKAFVPYKPSGQSSAASSSVAHSHVANAAAPSTPASSSNLASTTNSNASRFNYTRVPCPTVVMTSTGSLITSSLSGGVVTKQSLASVLHSNQDEHFQQLNVLPGPLDGPTGAVKPEQIEQSLQQLSSLSAESSRQQQLDDAAGEAARSNPTCLTQLLCSMIGKPIDWKSEAKTRIANLLKEVETGGLSSEYCHVPEEYMGQAIADIQGFIVKGDRQEAMACALHYRQFDMALLIAATLGKEQYDQVVSTMLREKLCSDNPLASVLKSFAQMDPDLNKADNLNAWQPQVAALLANDTAATAEELLAWGDALASQDYITESHFCYLTASLKPLGEKNARSQALFEAMRTKFTLLGGQHRRDRCRSAYSSPLTVFQTEVLEYGRQKSAANYRHPTMFQHRLAMALWFLEVGYTDKANMYLEALNKALPTAQQRAKNDISPRLLQHAVQDWRGLVAGYRGSTSQQGGGGLFGGLFGGGGKKPEPTTPGAPQAAAQRKSPQAASPAAAAPKKAVEAAPAKPKPEPKKADKKSDTPEKDGKKKKGGWWPWGKKQEEDVKQMILDSDPVEMTADGRYKFEMTDDEKKVQDQIKAGPPKMPMGGGGGMPAPGAGAAPAPGGGPPGAQFGGAAPGTPGGAPQYANPGFGAPATPGGMPPPGGAPPPMPGAGAPRAAPAQYVDMFNS